mgnify:CR=1 FL=1
MRIKIIHTWDNKFIPKRRFLFWWYQISEFEFTNYRACINWICDHYVPKQKKSRTAKCYKESEVYYFTPEYRDRIDIDFM